MSHTYPCIDLDDVSLDDLLILEAIKPETQAIISIQWAMPQRVAIVGPVHWVLWTLHLFITLKERDAEILGRSIDKIKLWTAFWGYSDFLNKQWPAN